MKILTVLRDSPLNWFSEKYTKSIMLTEEDTKLLVGALEALKSYEQSEPRSLCSSQEEELVEELWEKLK